MATPKDPSQPRKPYFLELYGIPLMFMPQEYFVYSGEDVPINLFCYFLLIGAAVFSIWKALAVERYKAWAEKRQFSYARVGGYAMIFWIMNVFLVPVLLVQQPISDGMNNR